VRSSKLHGCIRAVISFSIDTDAILPRGTSVAVNEATRNQPPAIIYAAVIDEATQPR
jgi:hypothetical protein